MAREACEAVAVAAAPAAAPPPAWLAALYARHAPGHALVFDDVVVRAWTADVAATGVVASDATTAWVVAGDAVRVVDAAAGTAATRTPAAVLADWRARGLRARARAHRRWREKCVDGQYVPSPEARAVDPADWPAD